METKIKHHHHYLICNTDVQYHFPWGTDFDGRKAMFDETEDDHEAIYQIINMNPTICSARVSSML